MEVAVTDDRLLAADDVGPIAERVEDRTGPRGRDAVDLRSTLHEPAVDQLAGRGQRRSVDGEGMEPGLQRGQLPQPRRRGPRGLGDDGQERLARHMREHHPRQPDRVGRRGRHRGQRYGHRISGSGDEVEDRPLVFEGDVLADVAEHPQRQGGPERLGKVIAVQLPEPDERRHPVVRGRQRRHPLRAPTTGDVLLDPAQRRRGDLGRLPRVARHEPEPYKRRCRPEH